MWRQAILPQNQNRFDKKREYRRERFLEMDQANLLFDANITDFTHEETVCCVAGDLMRRLREPAG